MVDREQAVPPSTDNKWQGSNTTRWRNEEYDKLFSAAQGELDPVEASRAVYQDGRHGRGRRDSDPDREPPLGGGYVEQAQSDTTTSGT
jgi:hypothetical protein